MHLCISYDGRDRYDILGKNFGFCFPVALYPPTKSIKTQTHDSVGLYKKIHNDNIYLTTGNIKASGVVFASENVTLPRSRPHACAAKVVVVATRPYLKRNCFTINFKDYFLGF